MDKETDRPKIMVMGQVQLSDWLVVIKLFILCVMGKMYGTSVVKGIDIF